MPSSPGSGTTPRGAGGGVAAESRCLDAACRHRESALVKSSARNGATI